MQLADVYRDFVSDEQRQYRFKLGKQVASALAGFLAGFLVGLLVAWILNVIKPDLFPTE